MVWVVLTGMPAMAVPNRVMAPAVSAQKPPTGFNLVILEPMVWTICHPPKYVPSAMAAFAPRMMGQWYSPQSAATSAGHQAAGVERAGDNSHRLLRIVTAVSETVAGGGKQL